MKKTSTIFGITMLVSAINLVIEDAQACSEIFIGKSGKVNVSARNFDFFTAGDGVIRFSPVGTAGQSQYTPQNCQPLKWIYFRTLNNPTIAVIDLNKLSATVKGTSRVEVLRTDLAGDINDLFIKNEKKISP